MPRSARIVISRFGGPEVLEIVEDELRDPREGEVRIRVLAAGVSWVERMMRRGSYPGQPKPPFTPGIASWFSSRKRVLDPKIADDPAMLQILGEEALAAGPESRLNDEGIPEGDLQLLSERDRPQDKRDVDLDHRQPTQAFGRLKGLFMRKPSSKLARDVNIELLEDLRAQKSVAWTAMLFQKSLCLVLLLGRI
ncbi:MAG: hypothetical protein WAM82_01460 [Thermoanaerobaculia bacterium]